MQAWSWPASMNNAPSRSSVRGSARGPGVGSSCPTGAESGLRGHCSQATSWPAGAQAVASLRRAETRRCHSRGRAPAGGREEPQGRGGRGRASSSDAPGGVRRRGSRPAATSAPSALITQVSSRSSRGRKAWRFRTDTRPASRSTASKATGCMTFLASCNWGLGFRSGCTSPLIQKFTSEGVSLPPKSPPNAQRSRPSFVVAMPWSTQSQMNPPCKTPYL
mmetsp:Transcript_12109/g.34288  ORF Transcript_12109/g.34288 Transcript_12109/m.34288 type:complete len:220 (-) Transcript_12109:1729-2388(-)